MPLAATRPKKGKLTNYYILTWPYPKGYVMSIRFE